MLKKRLDARCTFVRTNDNFARFSRNEKLQKKKKGKGYLWKRKHKMNYRQGFAKYLTIMREFYVT